VDTVRRFKLKFRGEGMRLYFLMGADSFLHIREWKDYETLLGLCDFIVASRPGFDVHSLRRVIPPNLLARPDSGNAPRDLRSIALRRTTIYVIDTVAIHGLVPPRVEEYITKQALYR
jgi:nicotinate-nucleotide adenylyltransferase